MRVKFHPCALISGHLKHAFKNEAYEKAIYLCRAIFPKNSPNALLLFRSLYQEVSPRVTNFESKSRDEQFQILLNKAQKFLLDGDDVDKMLDIGLRPEQTQGSWVISAKRPDFFNEIDFFYYPEATEQFMENELPSGQIVGLCVDLCLYTGDKLGAEYKSLYRLLIREVKVYNHRVEPFTDGTSFRSETEKDSSKAVDYISQFILDRYKSVESEPRLEQSGDASFIPAFVDKDKLPTQPFDDEASRAYAPPGNPHFNPPPVAKKTRRPAKAANREDVMETVYDKTPSFQIPDFLSQETRHSNPIAPQQEMAPVSSHKIPIDALDDDTEDEDFMAVIKKAKLTAAKR